MNEPPSTAPAQLSNEARCIYSAAMLFQSLAENDLLAAEHWALKMTEFYDEAILETEILTEPDCT